ncbi:MAG: hypothetical protein HGA51_00795 [Demequinaceae bacterium]|nr:hypothetical protein [Demequinaceae bacterium]
MTVFAPLWRTLTALRLARRDLRREPRRGALVIAMVALAASVVAAVGTVHASQTPTTAERLQAELGQNQAWVKQMYAAGAPIHQSPVDPYSVWSESTGDGALEGDDTRVDVTTLLPEGAVLVRLDYLFGPVSTQTRAMRASIIAGESWGASFAGLYDLTEGVAPTNADEALLSPSAARTLGVVLGDQVGVADLDATFTVVGILTPSRELTNDVIFVPDAGALAGTGESQSTWFLPATPLSWEQVQALNVHGAVAYSRVVALDPPPGSSSESGAVPDELWGSAAIGLAAVLLLAGSAFSVGFRRDQRRLALLAATGAGRGSLVSVGIATGLLLGLVGGVLGAGIGLGAGWGWVALMGRIGGEEGELAFWGYHWAPSNLVFAVVFGAVTGALSSLVPALVAARLDVMSALRGARKPARPHRATPWWSGAFVAAGVVLAVLGANRYASAVDLIGGPERTASGQASAAMVASFLILFLGLVVATPRLLRGLATAMTPWGVAARLAARDAARNAGRTVPVVAAIGMTAAISAWMVLTVDSDARRSHDLSEHNVPVGSARVTLNSDQKAASDANRAIAAVNTALPDATATAIQTVPWDGAGGTAVTIAIPEDQICPWHVDQGQDMTARERAEDPRCSNNYGAWVGNVAVGGAAELEAMLRAKPSDEALAALAGGGVVVLDGILVEDDSVELDLWDTAAGNFADWGVEPADSTRLSAVVAAPPDGMGTYYVAVMSPETAGALGLKALGDSVIVASDGGVSAEQEAEVNSALASVDGAWLIVERDFEGGYARGLMYYVLAVVLFAAGLSTAVALGLARADARRDDFTLASLGASPRLTRAAAGWQGAIIVATALVVGMVAGITGGWVDSHRDVQTTFSPPWLIYAGALIAVPVLVGSLAWLFTRAPKAVHYRLTA